MHVPRCCSKNWWQQYAQKIISFPPPAQPLSEYTLIFLPNGGIISHKKQPFHSSVATPSMAHSGRRASKCELHKYQEPPTSGLADLFLPYLLLSLLCVLYPFPTCCLPRCAIHRLPTWYNRLPAASARRWRVLQMANFEGGMPEPYIPPNKNTIYIRPAGAIPNTALYRFHFLRVPVV